MTRWMLTALAGAALVPLLALVLVAPSARGPEGDAASPESADGVTKDQQAGGTHWRFESRRGPIHVWMPAGYRHETAGIVLYVHGYYTDVDDAWTEHRLAEQFRASGRNALFIVPEAPARRYHKVRWRDLSHLIREVRSRIAVQRPWGPVVAVGHSGAYRTLLPWLSHRPLQHLILLDSLYAHEYPFREWLEQVKGQPNRLTMVAIDTLRWSELFARQFGYARILDWVPTDPWQARQEARSSRFVYMRSQYGHMALVTAGEAIPILLQMTELDALPGTP